jgi:uncharacterized protein (UPF0335 family)
MTNNQLQTIVQRIEKLEEEKAAIASDIKDVFSEAKSNGFDTKILKKVLALRKQDAAERMTEQAILATYMEALGMLADTPLGQAAMKSVAAPASKKAPPPPLDDEDDDDF